MMRICTPLLFPNVFGTPILISLLTFCSFVLLGLNSAQAQSKSVNYKFCVYAAHIDPSTPFEERDPIDGSFAEGEAEIDFLINNHTYSFAITDFYYKCANRSIEVGEPSTLVATLNKGWRGTAYVQISVRDSVLPFHDAARLPTGGLAVREEILNEGTSLEWTIYPVSEAVVSLEAPQLPLFISPISDMTGIVGEHQAVNIVAESSNETADLQYRASSSDESIATVSPAELQAYTSSSQITVMPAGEGTVTITVTVTNGTTETTEEFSVTVQPPSDSQDSDVSYVWDCENNDYTTFAYDIGLQCELTQSSRNMSVQDVLQTYLADNYRLVDAPPIEENQFNQHYNVEGCVFLYKELGAGPYAFSDVVICPVPLNQPVDIGSPQQQAVEETVAAVAAATVSNVTSNIGARFSAPNTGGASVSLAGMPVVFGQSGSHDSTWTSLADPFDALEVPWHSPTKSLTGDELLGSSSFEIALGAAEGSNSPDPGRQITVWGRGDFQVFESGGGQESGYDGDLVAGYLGADFNTGGSWLVGMALSRIKAEADYTLENAEGAGTLEAELTNLHPYVRVGLDDRSEAWAILGLGKGEVTDTAQQGASASTSDLSMHMMSAGARHLLNSFIGIDWALLGDGSLARVETSEGVQAVDGISASVWRVRAGVEASYTTVWEGGTSLTSFLEVAGRQDGGASAEGRGLELSPGLAFIDSESGFSVEARGRALVLHSADNHREYGASLTVSKAPDANGTGLSLAMTPTWGAPSNSLDSVDASLFPQTADIGRPDSLSLNSRVSYGFVAGPGVVAPFAEFSLHDSDSHRTRVGSRYSLGPSVDLELSGDRMSGGLGDPEHSVQFRARIGF